jgi:hypothetical protein
LKEQVLSTIDIYLVQLWDRTPIPPCLHFSKYRYL